MLFKWKSTLIETPIFVRYPFLHMSLVHIFSEMYVCIHTHTYTNIIVYQAYIN